MYQILKDFAGPVATIVASFAAAGITFFFARLQLRVARNQVAIAKQQADTALDQLRYNLFEKRYSIYKKSQDLIVFLGNESHKVDFAPVTVVFFYNAMEEARFFFSDQICDWLHGLQADCQKFLEVHASGNPLDTQVRLNILLGRLNEMPRIFQDELGFGQLTRLPDAPSLIV